MRADLEKLLIERPRPGQNGVVRSGEDSSPSSEGEGNFCSRIRIFSVGLVLTCDHRIPALWGMIDRGK